MHYNLAVHFTKKKTNHKCIHINKHKKTPKSAELMKLTLGQNQTEYYEKFIR